MIEFYGRTLKFVLGYQTITLLVALGTLALTIFLYIVIPKGFFPVQDTGVIPGYLTSGPDDWRKKPCGTGNRNSQRSFWPIPAVESLSSFIGADGTNNDDQQRPRYPST